MVNDTEPESILMSQIFSIYCHRQYLFILFRVNGGKWSLFLSSSLTYINGGRDRYFDGDYTSCKIKSVFKKKNLQLIAQLFFRIYYAIFPQKTHENVKLSLSWLLHMY